jgi:hypothetical protein
MGTHSATVQAAQGALAAITHSPAPRNLAGFAGYYGVKTIQIVIKLFQ